MKRMIIICFLLSGAVLFAQAEKEIKAGDFMLNGNIASSFYFNNTNRYDASGNKIPASEYNFLFFGISADAGYFIFDGFELGPTVTLLFTNYTYPAASSNDSSGFSISIGPQIGYYLDLDSLLTLFAS